jgi:hypothetical protein
MAGTGLKGGKTPKLAGAGAGGPVDETPYETTYGSTVVGMSFKQPFWGYETYDDNENIVGIAGDLISSDKWDVVKINGTPLPGIWTATATQSLQLDVQKPNGYDGAALIEKGYVPAGITMTGKLWTPEQWAHFQEMIPTFWRAPNKWAVNDTKKQTGQIAGEQLSLTIDYPGLVSLGIGKMVIYQMGPPEESGESGVRQIKMLARQYIPVPQKQNSAVKKVNGSGSVDLTAQAREIYKSDSAALAAANAKLPGQNVQIYPETSTAPLPPSQAQAGAKLPSVPAFLRRPD